MARVGRERVAEAKRILERGLVHPRGCSELVAAVLGIPWEDANSQMGASPVYSGVDGTYAGLSPGDVVGWTRAGSSGHVAIYIGEPGMKFIDVREPGARPRSLQNGYGAAQLYRSSKY